MRNISIVFVLAFLLGGSFDAFSQELKHVFDSRKSVDDHEFPLEALGKDMPSDWTPFTYLVLEIRSSTAQRFLLGIHTANGLHEKRTHLLPEAWLRLSIPLEYFREKPRPANDLAATVNKPLTVGFMHVEGGTVGPLTGVKGLTIKYYTPLDNPVIEIRSAKLTATDPGSAYLETTPSVDRFGQWARSGFAGKVQGIEDLQKEWAREEATLKPHSDRLSKYGGYLAGKSRATGFFRVEKINGKWWFIDPDGYYFLSIGANGIRPGGGGDASDKEGLRNVFEEFPPKNGDRYLSFGEWNHQRRYGTDWQTKWNQLTVRRMSAWGINTGLSGQSTPYLAFATAPSIPNVFGLQDIFIPDYEKRIDDGIRNAVSRLKDDPYLIGYFLQNEPSWLEQEPRVCELILNGSDTPLKTALRDYLSKGDSPARRTAFVHETFRKHIETVTRYLRKYDPNHLSLGIRFGHSTVPHQNILAICKDFFDVFSFNTYRISPNMDYVNEIAAKINLPMILGEFHFGTIDRGMAPGLVQVANQEERAVAFRYFAENAFAHPSLVGISWFQYTDQGMIGRRDGERYNIGIVDVTDRPYPIVNGIKEAASQAYNVHLGQQKPFSRLPRGLRGNEDDLKSKSNQ